MSGELRRGGGARCAAGTGVHHAARQWQCFKSDVKELDLCPGAVGSQCIDVSRKMGCRHLITLAE